MRFLKKKVQKVATPPDPVVGTAGSLREFVYLDETSVYSLTSAPDMPPPVTMSQSMESADGEVLSAQLEGGSPLLAKVGVSGEVNSRRSKGLQMQRQFNIQSQFARLHGMYRPTFLLTASAHEREAERASSLNNALKELEDEQRAVRAANLSRGALAELRVSLRAHHTFDITVFMRLVSGLMKKYPELLQVRDMSEIQTAMDAGEFLAELMEDLVPIEGRSTVFEIVTDTDGAVWIADVEALRSMWNGVFRSIPFRVVGVAEASSFWKDTRRILHAEAEFDVLGRISRDGLRDQWTPVKMIDTFRRVIPSAANGLVAAVEGLRSISDETSPELEPTAALVVAGTKLHRDLADHHGVEPSGLSPVAIACLLDDGTVEGKLGALRNVADEFYVNHGDLERDEDTIGAMRQAAWQSAQVLASLPSTEVSSAESRSETPVLELEFIAMYW